MLDDSFKSRYSTLPLAVYSHPQRDEATSFVAHNHREIELIAMTAGAATFFIGTLALDLTAGDLLVIPPYCVHYARMAPCTSYECLCFDPDLLCDSDLREGLEGGRFGVSDAVRAADWGDAPAALMLAAVAAHGGACVGWELEASGRLSLLFAALKRGGHFAPTGQGAREDRFCRAVTEYVAAHYGEPITSRTLAEHLYMSGAYFCRLFKRGFGTSFSEFLLAYRVEKAKLLLPSDPRSVSEIALACGFHSFSYFAKVFRDRVGTTPTAYRKKG